MIKPLNPGFSTADAEYPALNLAAGKLTLSFKDWRERQICIESNEVCAVKWQEIETLSLGKPYDGACEVLESEWVAEHVRQGAIPENSHHRHLRFNFNACGQLDVICTQFEVKA